MMPRPGTYRTEEMLGALDPEIAKLIEKDGWRIAKLDGTPIIGMTQRPDCNEEWAQAFLNTGTADGADYANLLRLRTIVVIAPQSQPQEHWAPGELYLKS